MPSSLALVLVVLISSCPAAAVRQTPAAARGPGAAAIPWKQCLDQPAAWYGTPEAIRIADNVLLYQRDDGGWHKNVDMAAPLAEKQKAELLVEKRKDDSTIDNGATY